MTDAVQTVSRTPASRKAVRFLWRLTRNLGCLVPPVRNRLFPAGQMAERFGRGDLEYGVSVFDHHWSRLAHHDLNAVQRILEVGPGRNLVTAVLFWAALTRRHSERQLEISLWDVFPNMQVTRSALEDVARSLLGIDSLQALAARYPDREILRNLSALAAGDATADVRHVVQPMNTFFARPESEFDLVYSHAALEHIWTIAEFWKYAIAATATGGWHSHRIDLADHGRRSTNYIEMLEWSGPAYWLMLRFVPGATNRWRATDHVAFVARTGLKVVEAEYHRRPQLPVPRESLAQPFKSLPEDVLTCTALDLLGRKRARQ